MLSEEDFVGLFMKGNHNDIRSFYAQLAPHLRQEFPREWFGQFLLEIVAMTKRREEGSIKGWVETIQRKWNPKVETSMPSEEQSVLRAMATKLQVDASKARLLRLHVSQG